MPRLFQRALFGLVLPAFIVSLLFALTGGIFNAMPLIRDMFAEGADRAELLAIIAEQVVDDTLRDLIFNTAVAAPALAVVGPLAFLLTRRAAALITTGAVAGLVWATLVDYYDSFFTGPGVEWDWPLAGGLYGFLAASLAVLFLKRRALF